MSVAPRTLNSDSAVAPPLLPRSGIVIRFDHFKPATKLECSGTERWSCAELEGENEDSTSKLLNIRSSGLTLNSHDDIAGSQYGSIYWFYHASFTDAVAGPFPSDPTSSMHRIWSVLRDEQIWKPYSVNLKTNSSETSPYSTISEFFTKNG